MSHRIIIISSSSGDTKTEVEVKIPDNFSNERAAERVLKALDKLDEIQADNAST